MSQPIPSAIELSIDEYLAIIDGNAPISFEETERHCDFVKLLNEELSRGGHIKTTNPITPIWGAGPRHARAFISQIEREREFNELLEKAKDMADRTHA